MAMATDKQLFVVQLSTEVIVLAESREAAEEYARDEYKELVSDGLGPDAMAAPMTYYPGEWDEGSIPYGTIDSDGDDPDRTIRDWVAMGAAPMLGKRPEATR
jgi:hypothetical protein